MKNKKKKTLNLLKWGSVSLVAYWVLTTLIFGQTNLDSNTGMISFRWSGLDAIFSSDEEFELVTSGQYKTNLKGIDGPYIFDKTKFTVDDQSNLIKENFNKNVALDVTVNNSDRNKFDVILRSSYEQESEYYEMPLKLIAISDIEGNFNAFYSLLLNNRVIDKNYNWIYGSGHLVLNGDFFDRGKNVTQILWLIYKLEVAAEKQKGKVHFINGNHEVMNLCGQISYSDQRYIEVAKQISKVKEWDQASRFLYSEKSELGKWLRTKNVVEKIGRYIFVHGGLNMRHVEASLDISEINQTARKYYGTTPQRSDLDTNEKLVLSTFHSPYWDRSLSMNLFYQANYFLNGGPTHKTTEFELDKILKFYDAEKIVIGHSVVNDVTLDYNGKVIKIDVKHGKGKNKSAAQGLLIENRLEYKIDGLGAKEKLENAL